MIVKYECINSFSINEYDDDGFITEGFITIDKGEVFECETESQNRMIGSWKDTLHLSNEKHWIELSKESIRKDFVQLE